VRFSIFLCFFLRMRLRRFLINDPTGYGYHARLSAPKCRPQALSGSRGRRPRALTRVLGR
jgi:hypothetical protein